MFPPKELWKHNPYRFSWWYSVPFSLEIYSFTRSTHPVLLEAFLAVEALVPPICGCLVLSFPHVFFSISCWLVLHFLLLLSHPYCTIPHIFASATVRVRVSSFVSSAGKLLSFSLFLPILLHWIPGHLETLIRVLPSYSYSSALAHPLSYRAPLNSLGGSASCGLVLVLRAKESVYLLASGSSLERIPVGGGYSWVSQDGVTQFS